MKKNYLIALLLIVVLIGGVAVLSRRQRGREAGAVPFPPLTLRDYTGAEVRFSDFSDVPLVINAWASWCPFCVHEMPDFARIQQEFGDRVKIIAVNRQESLTIAKNYTDRAGITDDLIFLLDPTDSFYRSIQGFSMPETIFVDSSGLIRDHKRGSMDADEIRQRLNAIMN